MNRETSSESRSDCERNAYDLKVTGAYALFTIPATRTGGEKCTYHTPTYEAIKGVLKSVYWKPSIAWHVKKLRVMNPIRTRAKASVFTDFQKYGESGFFTASYLVDVEYRVQACFAPNKVQVHLAEDSQNFRKHERCFLDALKKGGRMSPFLGTSECAAFVEPCDFDEGAGFYDKVDEISFGWQFHSFLWPGELPAESDCTSLHRCFWNQTMRNGVIEFPHPLDGSLKREFVKELPESQRKLFGGPSPKKDGGGGAP